MMQFHLLILMIGITMAQDEPVERTLVEQPLRIGAWNTQRLGKSKMAKPEVVNVFLNILSRYDIIVLQEITDSTQSSPQELLEKLNEFVHFNETDIDHENYLENEIPDIYGLALSPRLGRSSYKEQYGYYYRKAIVSLNETFTFSDPNDVFQAEPFVAVFNTPTAALKQVALIPVHTSPKAAVQEIDALVDVYEEVIRKTGIHDALILGDFNAGCSYVTGKKWEKIRLYTNPGFQWLITEHQDTTVKKTSCPYDRIVAAGNNTREAVFEDSAKPFYFDDEFHINDQELLKDVSDHFPVEVLLQGRIEETLKSSANPSVGMSLPFNVVSLIDLEQLMESCKDFKNSDNETVENQINEEVITTAEEEINRNLCPVHSTILVHHSNISIIEFVTFGSEKTIDLLETLSARNPYVISREVLAVVSYKLNHGVLFDVSIYGNSELSRSVTSRLVCIESNCTIYITKETTVQ